ncbi:hypothetical protein KC19_VG096600 [Ceratodon purpureus]|uniref:Uncharacterized protein n=1 Tax=Ceratodon purpureus TaxID=3225 RepID=A0A8T0HNL8_CERPU|nr:hypothetical protein KC19_VG096600 [Ceratodon purpureus]
MEEDSESDEFAALRVQGSPAPKTQGNLDLSSARICTRVFPLHIVNSAQDFSYNPAFGRRRATSSRGKKISSQGRGTPFQGRGVSSGGRGNSIQPILKRSIYIFPTNAVSVNKGRDTIREEILYLL